METKQQFQQRYRAYTKDILWMCIPLFFVSFFYFGPRVLFLALVAMFIARICDWSVSFVRSRIYDRHDTSSLVFALLIVLLMPANVPVFVVASAVVMAVLVAKEAFGGTGNYLFHPVAVGFCSAVVCWPDLVTTHPQFQVWFVNLPETFSEFWQLWTFENASIVNGPSYYLKTTALPPVELLNLFLGNYAGPLGSALVAVILACSIFLLVRRRISPLVLLCFLGTMVLLTALFPRVVSTPEFGQNEWFIRLQLSGYELLTGSTVFVGVFLAGDPTLLPSGKLQLAAYGILLGFFTVVFRYFGEFASGACFALLLTNALSGFIQSIGPKKATKSYQVPQADEAEVNKA